MLFELADMPIGAPSMIEYKHLQLVFTQDNLCEACQFGLQLRFFKHIHLLLDCCAML